MDQYYDNLVNDLGERAKLREKVLGKEANNTSPNKENNLPSIITPNEKKMKFREQITYDEAEKNIDELTNVPDDLHSIQPRPDQVWNCDKVGIDPNGKWHRCWSEIYFLV